MSFRIQTPQVGTQLQAIFRLNGRVNPELEEFIVPTIQVADLAIAFAPPERRHVSARSGAGAVSGERFVFRLECPPGMLIDVRRLWMSPNGTAGRVLINFTGPPSSSPSNSSTAAFTDGRLSQRSETPAGIILMDTQVGNITSGSQFIDDVPTAPANWDYRPTGWILGSGVSAVSTFMEGNFTVDNLAVDFAMEWDEYPVV